MNRRSRRADVALVARGYFDSRAKAQEAIAAGGVTADGQIVRKPSEPLADAAAIVAEAPHPWVSRGGCKLAAGLDTFGYDPAGRICLDLGASTGGFTHVLLARGAARVHAVDVGRDQLHPTIAADPRVVALQATDARHLGHAAIADPVDLLVADVSFISLKLVLRPALAVCAPSFALVALIKPQFEAGRAHLRKGIVRDAAVHDTVCADIARFVAGLGLAVDAIVPSPIAGGDGNREFLIGARRG